MVDRATGVDAEGRRSQRATPAPESAPRLELLTNFPPLPLSITVPFHPKNKIQKGKGFARVAWGRFSLISSSHLSRSSATLHLFIVRDQEENSMTPFEAIIDLYKRENCALSYWERMKIIWICNERKFRDRMGFNSIESEVFVRKLFINSDIYSWDWKISWLEIVEEGIFRIRPIKELLRAFGK